MLTVSDFPARLEVNTVKEPDHDEYVGFWEYGQKKAKEPWSHGKQPFRVCIDAYGESRLKIATKLREIAEELESDTNTGRSSWSRCVRWLLQTKGNGG